MLSVTALRLVAPKCQNIEAWAGAIECALTRFEINTQVRIAHFIAQVAEESNGFTRLEESLNYTPARLVQVWPHRFPTIESAAPYAGNPHKLADHVYSNRDGNGNEESGDGYKYRGRGLIMTTFHDNYARVQAALGYQALMCPDLLCTKPIAALAAGLYWHDRGLNALADKDDIEGITRAVNGGLNGLAQRKANLAAFKAATGEIQ